MTFSPLLLPSRRVSQSCQTSWTASPPSFRMRCVSSRLAISSSYSFCKAESRSRGRKSESDVSCKRSSASRSYPSSITNTRPHLAGSRRTMRYLDHWSSARSQETLTRTSLKQHFSLCLQRRRRLTMEPRSTASTSSPAWGSSHSRRLSRPAQHIGYSATVKGHSIAGSFGLSAHAAQPSGGQQQEPSYGRQVWRFATAVVGYGTETGWWASEIKRSSASASPMTGWTCTTSQAKTSLRQRQQLPMIGGSTLEILTWTALRRGHAHSVLRQSLATLFRT